MRHVRGTRIIDADGLVLAPGFIDLHSHGDCTLPAFPGRDQFDQPGRDDRGHRELRVFAGPGQPDRRARQRAPAPDRGDRAGPRLVVDDVRVVPGRSMRPGRRTTSSRWSASARFASPPWGWPIGRRRRWRSRRCATASHEALDAGAWGMSTGLVYPPGDVRRPTRSSRSARSSWPGTRCTPRISATRATSSATPSTRRSRIGSALGTRVEISHLKSVGKRNHGRIGRRLERIDAARAAGLG